MTWMTIGIIVGCIILSPIVIGCAMLSLTFIGGLIAVPMLIISEWRQSRRSSHLRMRKMKRDVDINMH